MRLSILSVLAILIVTSVACDTKGHPRTETKEQFRKDTESAARKAGHAAYEIKQETKEAAKKAGEELKKAGEQAREGWNDAKRQAKDKDKDTH